MPPALDQTTADRHPRANPRFRPEAETVSAPAVETRRVYVYLAAVLSGTMVSVAWWYPDTLASVLLGWAAALLLVFTVRARRSYLPSYCCGLACCSLGFYWIFGTVATFGGFGVVPAALVFGLFVVSSALQFLIFAFVHHNLGPRFDALALRSPTAIVVSELISIRLFAWHYGHTQVAFTPFVQVAGVGGALLVSFLMFWIAEALVRAVLFQERRKAFLLPVAGFAIALGYGVVMIRAYTSHPSPTQEVVLVQGNASLADNFESGLIHRNVERLHELSRKAARDNALFVWAEGAIPAYIPASVGSAKREPALPRAGDGSAFLVGAYAFQGQDELYNSAFAVYPDGTVPLPYFKQILIPFGEYMPLAGTFPWLKSLNGMAGVFSAGKEVKVFEFPMHRQDGSTFTLKVAPLICYEDTVPGLSREATRKGAELLVNLTYDTWFGRTAAPYEHHLIAAFRAIENRRYLVRATNSGLSAVVDPLGRTITSIPDFSEGTATATVHLIRDQSPYTAWVGDKPWWGLFALAGVAITVRRRQGGVGLTG